MLSILERRMLRSCAPRAFASFSTGGPSRSTSEDDDGFFDEDVFDETRPTSRFQPPRDTSKAEVDALWERVLRTPASILTSDPAQPNRPKSLLTQSTPVARNFKGTQDRMQRALGQTPAETSRVRDSLQAMFQDLNARMLRPDSTSEWNSLMRPSGGLSRRVEEFDQELVATLDAKSEELSTIMSPAEVVAWAEQEVFVREAEDGARAGYRPTYPRLLAAVMRHLRTLSAPHLSLAMFEHARSLGLESYLAGCQTSAFNELLRTRWDAFRDLPGVVAAVKEMEAHAVAWDKGTNAVVGSVADKVGKDLMRRREHPWGSDAHALLQVLEKGIEEDTRREADIFERKADAKRLFRHKERAGTFSDAQRINEGNQRFGDGNKRFGEGNQRFGDSKRRFDGVTQRFSERGERRERREPSSWSDKSWRKGEDSLEDWVK